MEFAKKIFITGLVAMMLVGCNAYKIEIDLSPEEIKEVKDEITVLKEEIANFVPSDDSTIAWQEIIELARAYEELGELGKAIDVYVDVLNDGHKTKAILNNLGRLYEQTEQYGMAITMYERIHKEYLDQDYLYDITWAYIRAGDRKSAEKYFNAWQLEFNRTDEQTQQAIKKLREAEKASE
jgi:tetratricopeptide (TPR) repeat protein